MKLAIMTMQSQNFGNRLQNYALQEVLRDMGHDAESLRRDSGIHGDLSSKYHTVKSRLGAFRHVSDRVGRFRAFDRERIAHSSCIASNEYVTPGLADRYDGFVIGSDQVWNPCVKASRWIAFLPDMPSAKKISYAASFGVKELDAEDVEPYREMLAKIPNISVREDAGSQIVQSICGRAASVVLDPTLLLAANRWEAIEVPPVNNEGAVGKNGYCFKYFLGTDAENRMIASMAHERGLNLVDAMDPELAIGPAEFIWLIHHASLVCTDSFHGSVFSLMFHIPLVVFNRKDQYEDMSSRFDTLDRQFGIAERTFGSEAFRDDAAEHFDAAIFESKREVLRAESIAWLQKSLEDIAL